MEAVRTPRIAWCSRNGQRKKGPRVPETVLLSLCLHAAATSTTISAAKEGEQDRQLCNYIPLFHYSFFTRVYPDCSCFIVPLIDRFIVRLFDQSIIGSFLYNKTMPISFDCIDGQAQL